jgi:O-antigen/teichoic acid export membrane protein
VAADESRSRPQSITHNTLFSLAEQMVGAAVTAGLLIFLARALEPHEFGVLSLALSVAGLLALPSDFGIAQSASRFAAEHRGDDEAIAEVVASALRLKLYIGGAVTIGLILAAGPIADAYAEPDLVWPIRALALMLFGQSMMGLYGGVLVAIGRGIDAFRITVVKSVVEAVTTVAFVLVVAGAAEAAAGRAVAFLIGGLVAFVIGAFVLGRQAIGLGMGDRTSTRRLMSYGGAIFIIDGAFVLFQQIDTLLIGAMLSATAAGLFQVPIRLITFLRYPALAIANGVAPRLASMTGEDRTIEPFQRGLRYAIVFQALLIAPCVVWAAPIIDLTVGEEYAESAEVLRALAPFVFLSGLGTLLSLGVNFLGEARRRMPIAIAAVLVNLVIDLILIPEIGIVGAAIGTNVAFTIYVGGHLWVCRRMIDLPLGPLGLSVLRSLVAAAAMAGLLAALGTGDVAVPILIGGLIAGSMLYLAVIVALRELPLAELRRVGGRVLGAVGRSS